MPHQKPARTFYFARDPLGRRSLLIHPPTPSEPFLAISSATNRYAAIDYNEVSTEGVFSLSLDGDDVFEVLYPSILIPRLLILGITKCMSSVECIPRGASVFVRQIHYFFA